MNFWVASVELYMQPEVQQYSQYIDAAGGVFYYRFSNID